MEAKFKIIAVWIAIAALVYFYGLGMPAQQQSVVYVSTFGLLAVLDLAFVLLIPSIVRWKSTPFTRFLLINRRWIGLSAFFFAVAHIFCVYQFFFMWDLLAPFSTPGSLFLMLGAIGFLILTLMAATSNDFAVEKLGQNWKRLHLFVYLAFALVVIHAWNIGLIHLKELWIQALIGILVIAIVLLKTGIVKFGS